MTSCVARWDSMSDEVCEQYSFRLPGSLVERIEERLEKAKEEQPGRRVKRADIVRELLHAGLEATAPKRKKGRKK